MSTQPTIWCQYDRCCSFDPGSHNARYCPEHKCKRKNEAAVKRLSEPPPTGEELWQLQEQRKEQLGIIAQQKNAWLLANKRIVFFDLETFDLAADFGLVMVGCIKDRGGAIKTYSAAAGDPDERDCILGIRDELEAADYVCTWYGTKFDLPYINTRLLINNERPIAKIRHIDAYYTARFKLKLQSNRLAAVELALLGQSHKTAILPGIWRRALRGDKEALDYIIDHCERDVQVLEDVFEKLRGFINFSATRWRRYGASY